MEGAGLNITVISYRDAVDFGFMVGRDLVPDVWAMADAVEPAFDELAAPRPHGCADEPADVTMPTRAAVSAGTRPER